MATQDDHELIDVGAGRRLDRFGAVLLDRPCPPADWWPQRDPGAWPSADARFDRAVDGAVDHAGWTTGSGKPIEPWCVRDAALQAELRLAGSGQVGWFPEQGPNRAWIGARVRELAKPGRRGRDPEAGPPAVLNLFGYTGGSTLAAVAAGAAATHVDGARTAVAWARRNAELNGFADRPVRWIADDAVAFAGRERRRGRRYAGIVLDPPSYGHGAGRPRLAAGAGPARPARGPGRAPRAVAGLLRPPVRPQRRRRERPHRRVARAGARTGRPDRRGDDARRPERCAAPPRRVGPLAEARAMTGAQPRNGADGAVTAP